VDGKLWEVLWRVCVGCWGEVGCTRWRSACVLHCPAVLVGHDFRRATSPRTTQPRPLYNANDPLSILQNNLFFPLHLKSHKVQPCIMSFDMGHYLCSHDTSPFNMELELGLFAASQEALQTNCFDELYETPISGALGMRFDIAE
jgi:hypothetical protein